MLKLDYVKCSPGGNITVLIFTPVERTQQSGVARQIMALQPDVEQVGFVKESNDPRAVARLQMMGGEFCGNATRSLAWALVEKKWPGTPQSDGAFALKVSGAERLLQVRIHGRVVRVEMPIKRELSSVRRVGNQTVVDLEGISHVLVNRPPPPNARDEANRLLDELGLRGLKAAGVLYCEPREDGVSIAPVVWVRDAETLVEETACASGSVCVALARAAATGTSQTGLRVYQPGGGVIITSVELANDAFSWAVIEGPVEILEEGEVAVHTLTNTCQHYPGVL